MKNDPIIINEAHLRELQATYKTLSDELSAGLTQRRSWTAPGGGSVSAWLDDPLPLRLGVQKDFHEADVDAGLLNDKIRKGLVDRLTKCQGEVADLEYALRFLLKDSEAVEHLAELSGSDFAHFLPPGS